MDGIGRVEVDCGGEAVSDAPAASGKRTRKRDSLFLSARLSFAGTAATHDVRVRNLSEGGLMAEFDRAIQPGTVVGLEMRGLGEITGHVAWCAHGRLGISLDQPVDPARARKPVGVGKQTPGYAKPMLAAPRR